MTLHLTHVVTPPLPLRQLPQLKPRQEEDVVMKPVTPPFRLRHLADLKPPVTRDEPKTLWRAARSGNVNEVKEAVAQGHSLDTRDGLGRTPLVLAVVHGRRRCVDVLLEGGADPEACSGHGTRPLAYAAFRGDARLCALLLAKGADPNQAAADGWTALHVAARQGASDVVQLLLTGGANRDAATGTGRTALVVATAFGELRAVRALLNARSAYPAALLALEPRDAERALFPLLQTVRSAAKAQTRVRRGLATLHQVRAAGSWRRHLASRRRDLVVIRALQHRAAARGRPSTSLPLDALPDPLFRHVAGYFWGG